MAQGLSVSAKGKADSKKGAKGEAEAKTDDKEKKKEEDHNDLEHMHGRLPARVPWRGTAFTWSHSFTTSMVGVGQDQQSDAHEVYTQSFAQVFNYYLTVQKKYSIRMASSVGVDIEMTNSNDTAETREPLLRDVPLQFVGSFATFKGGPRLLGNFTTLFPTSKASRKSGVNLRISPRLLVMQVVPLLGKDSDFLKAFYAGVSGRWDHTFSDADTAVNEDLQRPRQTATGTTFLSDQLSGVAISKDSLRIGGFIFFAEEIAGMPLWASAGMSITENYISPFSSQACEAQTQNSGCVTGTRIANQSTRRVSTGFGASATIFPMVEWGLSFGYSNNSLQLGADGQRRSVFYSPGAVFSIAAVLSFDAIYERATGPARNSPFILFGKNDKKKKKKDDKNQYTTESVRF